MFSSIYIEKGLIEHFRVRDILERFPNIPHIECNHYSEIFNRHHQNFRLQKKSPSLILANKKNRYLLATPEGYGVGDPYNYYFSHMLNCVYDCRYCFLQGMYNSAHYVLFVNFESFENEIKQVIESHAGQSVGIYSGYDCDSLALEPVTHFVEYFLNVFEKYPQAMLELRTKSTQVRSLLQREPFENCVVAYSFTAEKISNALEHKVPTVAKRIDSLMRVQKHGWPIGLRFDPVIYSETYRSDFKQLCEQIFTVLDVSQVHSVSLGAFRMPQSFMKKLVNLYPEEKLFAGNYETNVGMMSYPSSLEQEMMDNCKEILQNYICMDKLFHCNLA